MTRRTATADREGYDKYASLAGDNVYKKELGVLFIPSLSSDTFLKIRKYDSVLTASKQNEQDIQRSREVNTLHPSTREKSLPSTRPSSLFYSQHCLTALTPPAEIPQCPVTTTPSTAHG